MNKTLKTFFIFIGITCIITILYGAYEFLMSANETLPDTLELSTKELLKELNNTPGNFTILFSTITASQGDKKEIYLKFKNPSNNTVYKIFDGGEIKKSLSRFNEEREISNTPRETNFYYKISGQQAATSRDSIIITGPAIELDPSGTDAFKLDLNVGDDVVSGIYYLTFKWKNVGTRNYSEIVTLIVE